MVPVCYLHDLIADISGTKKTKGKKDKIKTVTAKNIKESKKVENVSKENKPNSLEKEADTKNFKTWADIKRFLRNNYRVADEENDNLVFDFNCGNDRTQRVFVSFFSSKDNKPEWLQISSCIGLIDISEINEALAEVADCNFGGVVFEKEINRHVLQGSLPFDSISRDGLLLSIETIAKIADLMEKKYIGGDQY